MTTETDAAMPGARDEKEGRLARVDELAGVMFAASQAALAVLDRDLRIRRVNPAFGAMFMLEPGAAEGRSIFEAGGAAWQVPELRRVLAEPAPPEDPDDVEVAHQRPDLGKRTLSVRARWLDREPGWLLAIEDVSDRRGAEEMRARLTSEARHRVRNLLAKVNAIVALSQRDQTSVAAYADRLAQRIGSFARTEDLIGRQGQRIDLHQLVAGELASVRGGERAWIEGPAVSVPAGIAQPLALAVHELASNASRYGGLHLPEAQVRVTWELSGEPDRLMLRLQWEETGVAFAGEPAPGFGLRLVREIAPQMMGGSSSLGFSDRSVRCVLEIPLDP